MTTYPNISKVVKNTPPRVVVSNSLLGVWDYDLTLPYYLKSSKGTTNLLFLRKKNTGSTPANPKAYSLFAFTTKNIKIK